MKRILPRTRLLVLVLIAGSLATLAYANNCFSTPPTDQNGNSSCGTLTVCCSDGNSGWLACNCNGWDASTGYFDCGHGASGCFPTY